MSILKTILCALSFVTTSFAMDDLYQISSDGRVVRVPMVEYPDLCGIDNYDIDRLISSKETPFVGKATFVALSLVQAVNLTDTFSKEEERGSANGTQASNNDQTPNVEIEQTEDDAELSDNLEIESLKSVEVVLDDKDVKERQSASAECCVIQ